MKLKAKLISTIAAFAMVLCLTIVGVWAASQVSVSLTGTITFTSDHVVAEVQLISITGTDGEAVNVDSYRASFNSETTEALKDVSWTMPADLTFKQGSDVVLTFKVTNKSDERAITSSLTSTSTVINAKETLAYGAAQENTTDYTSAASNQIAANASAYYKVTIKVESWDKSANYGANLKIALANVAG